MTVIIGLAYYDYKSWWQKGHGLWWWWCFCLHAIPHVQTHQGSCLTSIRISAAKSWQTVEFRNDSRSNVFSARLASANLFIYGIRFATDFNPAVFSATTTPPMHVAFSIRVLMRTHYQSDTGIDIADLFFINSLMNSLIAYQICTSWSWQYTHYMRAAA